MRGKAVFLDRDGTINVDKGFVHRKEDFTFVDGAASAIGMLNRHEYKVVVVTNQSGVSRGIYTEEDVRKLHVYVNDELRKHGAHIDRFYFCPHHPEAPLKEYQCDCDCRKPKPGMVLQAIKDLDLDISTSYIVGDREWDISAGKRAGLTSILIRTDDSTFDNTICDEKPDMVVKSLHDAVQYILDHD
jgi:D-glycero-D-manno-heptose 1,7-bisphosphate phosphatase